MLADGITVLNPPDVFRERCVIEQPAASLRIAGGVLAVTGRMRPFNDQPVTVELVAQNGSILGSQQVAVPPAADDSYVPFRLDVPYTIPWSNWALLVVRQDDDRIDGLMYLYSQEVFLNP